MRKVLNLLSAEGFVVLNRGKSATVAKISYQETKDLYQLLGILESKSTELATPNLRQADIKELKQINRMMEGCIDNKDRPNARKMWQEANLKFHRKIAQNTGNKEMEMLVENIRWRTFDFRYVYFFEQKFEFFCTQHDQLIDAFENGEAVRARQIMEDHVFRASEVALNNLRPDESF